MKNKVFLCMILILALMGTFACGKKENESSTVTADSSAKEILDAANKKYAEYQLRGTECQFTYMYADGSSAAETGTTVLDVNKGIQHSKYQQNGKNSGETFSVKEGNKYYTYAYDTEKNIWVRYEQVADENGKTTYQHQLDGELFLFDEKYGYSNVTYSNEGKENVEGVDTIKIKITMDDTPTTSSEDAGTVTKEDILSDYDLTEEYVEKIDGLSEALDEYVAAMNESIYGATTHFENYVWVKASDFTPVKYESNTKFDDTDEMGKNNGERMRAFEDNYWMASMLKDCMESGMGYDEAMKEIQESKALMNQEMQDENEAEEEEDDFESEEDAEPEQIGFQSVEIYRYGKDCVSVGDLPKEYKEITEDDYVYGEY